MATTPTSILTIVAMMVLPTIVFAAVEYIVGDDGGWRPDFDYANWAKNKTFIIGDNLVFKYGAGAHNVYQVTEQDYDGCIVPKDVPLSSGLDNITLDTPGPRYFFCGVGLHCEKGGQKLHIIVKEREANATSQGVKSQTSSGVSKGISHSKPAMSPSSTISRGSTKKSHGTEPLHGEH